MAFSWWDQKTAQLCWECHYGNSWGRSAESFPHPCRYVFQKLFLLRGFHLKDEFANVGVCFDS